MGTDFFNPVNHKNHSSDILLPQQQRLRIIPQKAFQLVWCHDYIAYLSADEVICNVFFDFSTFRLSLQLRPNGIIPFYTGKMIFNIERYQLLFLLWVVWVNFFLLPLNNISGKNNR